ncbi:hypothetical protein AQ824_21585 [Burkholderia pseudomallei]|nr:hypothetical protein UQ47_09810 [Burkholderia pseudomallei]KGX96768.1 hypothetical protein X997_5023 [Burkholderia pseudomallei A79C]ARK41334.1 hypothetical protein BOC60_14695 [Burkholderia pseudomallei]OAB16968.1 hypothetical protein AQ846_07640 [Burkholderia pseudomallei]OMQ72215.1 hypothetical protein AQ713_06725 [Burkholderia pseudomallei]
MSRIVDLRFMRTVEGETLRYVRVKRNRRAARPVSVDGGARLTRAPNRLATAYAVRSAHARSRGLVRRACVNRSGRCGDAPPARCGFCAACRRKSGGRQRGVADHGCQPPSIAAFEGRHDLRRVHGGDRLRGDVGCATAPDALHARSAACRIRDGRCLRRARG